MCFLGPNQNVYILDGKALLVTETGPELDTIRAGSHKTKILLTLTKIIIGVLNDDMNMMLLISYRS